MTGNNDNSTINYNKEDYTQLIILGNGFDLKCGLKSSYTDFFKNRYETENFTRLEKIIRTIGGSITDENRIVLDEFSVWDLVFYSIYSEIINNNEILWVDVEKELFNFFFNKKNGSTQFELLYKYIIDEPVQFNVNDHLFLLSNFLTLKNYNLTMEVKHREDPRILSMLLRTELEVFEEKFANYLSSIINNTYKVSSKNTLQQIISLGNNYEMCETKILSFNYTNQIYNNSLESKIECLNIHGLFDNGTIVFGFDLVQANKANKENDANFSDAFQEFSKTYKVLLNSFNGESNMLFKTKPNHIKFYGHSLGEADYSYFQSIFDIVDLYNSETILTFLYSDYKGDSILRRNEQLRESFKLLQDYGNTLTNKEHGKNLLHKLILENRLNIKEIL